MIIPTVNCESCNKLSHVKKLNRYKPRQASRFLLLCDTCYNDFMVTDEHIRLTFQKMKEDGEID